ncbi:MAG TPA: hypothetical protein VMW62_01000 [Chloroflexota bacterium]|nr:hypothetical protein [Chloroflexota bacterium]
MAIGAIGTASLSQHLQVQGATQSSAPAKSQAPSKTQSGSKIDRDGDFDNSSALSDAAEGKGSKLNLSA